MYPNLPISFLIYVKVIWHMDPFYSNCQRVNGEAHQIIVPPWFGRTIEFLLPTCTNSFHSHFIIKPLYKSRSHIPLRQEATISISRRRCKSVEGIGWSDENSTEMHKR